MSFSREALEGPFPLFYRFQVHQLDHNSIKLYFNDFIIEEEDLSKYRDSFPPGWLSIIEKDSMRQELLDAQRPFSDAYLFIFSFYFLIRFEYIIIIYILLTIFNIFVIVIAMASPRRSAEGSTSAPTSSPPASPRASRRSPMPLMVLFLI